jgi:hypothetical protein
MATLKKKKTVVTVGGYRVKYLGNNVWGVVDTQALQIIYWFVNQAAAEAVCDDLNGGGDDVPDEYRPEGVSGDHGIE